MRYVIAVGENECGPILIGPGGGCLIYDSLEEAGDACKTVLKGNLAEIHPDWNAFVLKLVPAALYMPIPLKPGEEPFVDETIIIPETISQEN